VDQILPQGVLEGCMGLDASARMVGGEGGVVYGWEGTMGRQILYRYMAYSHINVDTKSCAHTHAATYMYIHSHGYICGYLARAHS
jgi:hypothetical protein